jgi:hypothetical protein
MPNNTEILVDHYLPHIRLESIYYQIGDDCEHDLATLSMLVPSQLWREYLNTSKLPPTEETVERFWVEGKLIEKIQSSAKQVESPRDMLDLEDVLELLEGPTFAHFPQDAGEYVRITIYEGGIPIKE